MPKHPSHSAQLLITAELSDGQFSIRHEKVLSGETSASTAKSEGTARIRDFHQQVRDFSKRVSILRQKRLLSGVTTSPDDVLTWVSTTKSEGAARINEILELIVELVNVGRKNGDEEAHLLAWQGRVLKVRVNPQLAVSSKKTGRETELASRLNHKIARYKFAPWYYTTIVDYPIFGWWSGKNRPRDDDDPAEDVWFTEEDAIIAIIDLAREGLLCRIRRCECGDWFLAKFAHQKFCCLRCQQNHYRSSENYKAKRRTYMKNLRELHKKTYLVSPKERACKLAKRSARPQANTNKGQIKGKDAR